MYTHNSQCGNWEWNPDALYMAHEGAWEASDGEADASSEANSYQSAANSAYAQAAYYTSINDPTTAAYYGAIGDAANAQYEAKMNEASAWSWAWNIAWMDVNLEQSDYWYQYYEIVDYLVNEMQYSTGVAGAMAHSSLGGPY